MTEKLHILITGRHLNKCHVGRLYGLHPGAVNQAAAVNEGDRAFIFSNFASRIYGPYEVAGEHLYLGSGGGPIIWEKDEKTPRERFRVVFRIEPAGETMSAPIRSLYELARSAGVIFEPEDVINRSIYTFLPGDTARLLPCLKRLPWQKALFAPAAPEDTAEWVPLRGKGLNEMAAREKVGESFVEYLLARGTALSAVLGEGAVVWNQLRVLGERSRIDLIYRSGPTLYIIELKTGPAGRPARREAIKYAVWAQANRAYLDAQFRSGRAFVQPVVVGKTCPEPANSENILVSYELTDNCNINLRRMN